MTRVSSAVILNEHGEVLVQQRLPGRAFPLYWELPGGKVNPGEDNIHACRRELQEELSLDIVVWPRPLVTVAFNKPLTTGSYDVSLFLCTLDPVDQVPKLNDAVRWTYCSFDSIPEPRMPSLNVFLTYLQQAGGLKHLRLFIENDET